jgi:hypothetical protein
MVKVRPGICEVGGKKTTPGRVKVFIRTTLADVLIKAMLLS